MKKKNNYATNFSLVVLYDLYNRIFYEIFEANILLSQLSLAVNESFEYRITEQLYYNTEYVSNLLSNKDTFQRSVI